jgi:NAD(P)-dependent dehydrogenase (short-subunit alcohol dehydrogenase family)
MPDLRRIWNGCSQRGRVDVLVVNAGISEFSTLGTITPDHFDRSFGLNVQSLLFATQEAIDLMPDGGTVVLIGSIAGMIGTKGYGVYGAGKAAVRAFARTRPTNWLQGTSASMWSAPGRSIQPYSTPPRMRCGRL